MALEAEILPLNGKYYGTEVRITDAEREIDDIVTIWCMGDYKPSVRELGNATPEEWSECCFDSHYESAFGYWIAKKLVEAIDGADG